MKRGKKKIILMACIAVMICCCVMFAGTIYCDGNVSVKAADTISREEWIHILVDTFQMKVESELTPDDYYADVSESSTTYYRDIMTAVNFGVIDLEAGEEFKPKEAATREFAAQTLNFCLGYELDEDTQYTMNDINSLKYIQADQIALNQGWFTLINGAFQPNTAVTTTEKNTMINFAKQVLTASKIDENYKSTYEFADGVVVVPEGTIVELGTDHKVIIYDTSVKLAEGDVFAVFSNGLAYVYKAVKITSGSDAVEIQTEEVDFDKAVKKYDAEGIVDAELGGFEPASDDIVMDINYADGTVEEGADTSENARQARIQGSKKIKDVKVYKNIGGGKISCTVSDIRANYRTNSIKGEYLFSITGKAKASCTVKAKNSLTLTLGTFPIAGVGRVQIDMIYSAEGSVTISLTSRFETGIEKVSGQPVRKLNNFTAQTWGLSAQVELKEACKISFVIEIPTIAKGSIYGEAGIKAGADMEVYTDGKKPKVCMDLAAYMYAEAGYSVSVFSKERVKDTIEIYSQSDSPLRVYYHIEDGKRVAACKRPESSSRVGKRGYYSLSDAAGTYSSGFFVLPEEEAVPTFEYEVDDAGNATITKYNGKAYSLTLPEELDGYPVTGIGEGAFRDNTALGAVTIPNQIISIGKGAFNGCSNLQDVVLPENSKYTYIDEGVFANTTSLSDIQMPDYITEIKKQAFYKCGLKSIKLNDDITYIGEEAFYGCVKLSDLVLPKYLEIYGSSCFGDCDLLYSIEIPRYIKENDYYPDYHYMVDKMQKGMFYGCDNLKEVNFAKGVTTVPHNLFNGCTGIEEITLPDTITEIGYHAFNNCTALKNINLPESLTKINVMAFRGCTSLENVAIPDSVTEIESCAFISCDKLSDVHMPSKLKKIGTWAFKNCSSLQTITIPQGVTEVLLYYDGFLTGTTESPFVGCGNLKEVGLENGMQQIANMLFKNFTDLERILIPDSVVEIKNDVFENASALKEVTLSKNLTTIGDKAFLNCTSLEQIEIPDTVNSMGPNVFEGCTLLKNVKLPKGRIHIPARGFRNCTSLKQIEFPASLQYVDANAFEGCEKLESIAVPNGFIGIEKNAFKDCKRLASADLKGNYIAENAFENCRELVDVKLSDSIFNIGKSAFLNCTSIEKIHLSTSISEISANAFEGCTYLDNVIIPYGVDTIGNEAFKNCTKLKTITIPKNVTTISDTVFSYPEEITVYGVKGSYAEGYANNKGMTFIAKTVNVETAEFSNEKYIVNVREKIKIPLLIKPEDCTDDITWLSSDTEIADINEVGTVTGKKYGECTITVKVGNIEKTCKVQVKDKTYGLRLIGDTWLIVGDTVKFACVDTDGQSIEAGELEWRSSSPDIVEVDQKGNVRAIKQGNANIEVSFLKDASVKGMIEIEVTDDEDDPGEDDPGEEDPGEGTNRKKVSKITLSGVSYKVAAGKTIKLTANVKPSNAANKSLTWKSSNPKVATVNNKGSVTMQKGSGGKKVTITATAADGSSVKASYTITSMKGVVKKVTLSGISKKIAAGQKIKLTANVTTSKGANKTLSFKSSNLKVATVNKQGVVTVKKNSGGKTATITASATDGSGKKAVYKITSMKGAVKKITISGKKTVKAGRTLSLKAKVSASYATKANKKLQWTSSNTKYATVSSAGKVRAKKPEKEGR